MAAVTQRTVDVEFIIQHTQQKQISVLYLSHW